MSEATKDFFKLHSQIMEQFKAFSQSFVDIEDPQILKELEKYGVEYLRNKIAKDKINIFASDAPLA